MAVFDIIPAQGRYSTSFFVVATNEVCNYKPKAGFVGVNYTPTDSLLSSLDVRGSNGTLAIASFSGRTSFGGLVVDNIGFGDLITASFCRKNPVYIPEKTGL